MYSNMVFACQRDSYLQEFHTKAISCESAKIKLLINGKNEIFDGYNVVLEDTILFPEGGGQPDDRGTISNVQVLRITRNKDSAVHFVTQSVPLNEEIPLKLDWVRRFDHMQQHSGQHLLSAVAENKFKLKTTSWNLGELISYVEIDAPVVEFPVLKELEEIVNDKIRAAIPVTVKTYEKGSEELEKAHSRGLPDDHSGLIRIISIEGVDENMCCGTHVKNLSELQAIKIVSLEKGKKNKCNLYFLVGNRILSYMQKCIEKERIFTCFLKCGSDQHVELLEKMSKSLKTTQKNELNLIRDLALLEAQKVKQIQPKPKFYSIHRKEGNSDFMSIITNEVKDEDILLFITVGDEKGAGQVTISGKAEIVKTLGPKVGEILDGKGVAKGNRYLGKVNNLSQRSKAEQMIKDEISMNNEI
uniref:Threonyl/alanyl tRNA synthetase SAD domain-containing protein n=1 Tax=Strigamia maritima TaxID=126957 RepID=T1JDQ2_STRMM